VVGVLCPITGQARKIFFIKNLSDAGKLLGIKTVYKRRLYNRGSGIVGLHAALRLRENIRVKY
jgi:hypothetical protein